MGEHKTLKKALRQMAEGSKSGFHTFYLGTSQYVYSSALLLYDSHEDACRFMLDFYQYLYLHLPAYDRSANLENWIARLLMERYEQLSIGKNMPKPSVKQKMDSAAAQLSKSEQERIWRMLDVNIHFPKETVHRSPIKIALFVSALLLALLIASRYVPSAIAQLWSAFSASASADDVDNPTAPDGDDAENTGDPDAEGESESRTDELDSIRDDLENLLNEQRNTDTDSSDDNSDTLHLQQSGSSDDSDATDTPASPTEPGTPQEPDPPQEPQSPSLSDHSETRSATDDLDDLELQLRYGDSLLFADPGTDSN